MNKYRICNRCIMDTSDPDITFDSNGICNKCAAVFNKLHSSPYNLSREEKMIKLNQLVKEIKKDGRGKPYDCIIGVSGGIDSTYVAYKVKSLGLNPLAVHLDNGWNSEIAQKNIEEILKKLDIDLFTYVINWEEFKAIQLSFLKASTPDSEIPTDHAIIAVLYEIAAKNNLHYILTGVNIATESVAATSWSNGIFDWKYLYSVHKQFGTKEIKTLPHFSLIRLFYYRFLLNIKRISILDYDEYNKKNTLDLLEKKIGYRYYGDKHFESIYTRFFQAYVLPRKFGFDKRRPHLSSLICSGQITRKQALSLMKKPVYENTKMREDEEYVKKKLSLTNKEFNEIMNKPIHNFFDYPSYQKEWYYKFAFQLNDYYKKIFSHKYYY